MSGYFVDQAARCVVMLMVSEKSDPDTTPSTTATRLRLVLNPGEMAGLDSEEGRSLNFTCGEERSAARRRRREGEAPRASKTELAKDRSEQPWELTSRPGSVTFRQPPARANCNSVEPRSSLRAKRSNPGIVGRPSFPGLLRRRASRNDDSIRTHADSTTRLAAFAIIARAAISRAAIAWGTRARSPGSAPGRRASARAP